MALQANREPVSVTCRYPPFSSRIGDKGPAWFTCWVYCIFILTEFILFIKVGKYSVYCIQIMCSHLIQATQFAIVNLMAGFLNICVLLLLFIFFKEISQSCRWLAHLQIPLQGTLCWWCLPPLSCAGAWNWLTGEGCIS